MVATLFPYHNAPSSSGSLVTTNKPNNKEHFHSGDILSLYTLVKTKFKKKKKNLRKAVYVSDVLPYTVSELH